MNWREGIMRMLRLTKSDQRPADEEYEREKIRIAKLRLAYLDHQADIIARRSGKTHL